LHSYMCGQTDIKYRTILWPRASCLTGKGWQFITINYS
jgi:hypothetical protein